MKSKNRPSPTRDPLGLAVLSLTTFCLSMVNAGFVDKSATIVVIAWL